MGIIIMKKMRLSFNWDKQNFLIKIDLYFNLTSITIFLNSSFSLSKCTSYSGMHHICMLFHLFSCHFPNLQEHIFHSRQAKQDKLKLENRFKIKVTIKAEDKQNFYLSPRCWTPSVVALDSSFSNMWGNWWLLSTIWVLLQYVYSRNFQQPLQHGDFSLLELYFDNIL